MDAEQQFDSIFGAESAELEQEVAEFEAEAERKSQEAGGGAESEPATPVAPRAEEAPTPEQAKPAEPQNASVPLAVFLETKNELKELRRELAELRAPKPEPQAPAGPPTFEPSVPFDQDPATYLKEQGEYLERLALHQGRSAEEARALAAYQARQMQEQRGMQTFTQQVSRAEDEFRQQAPDYDEAVAHIWASHQAEAKALLDSYGQPMTQEAEQQIEQALVRTFAQVAQNALRVGKNPAAAVYAMARSRGYAPKQAQQSSNVERLQRGVQASKSAQNVPGFGAAPSDDDSGPVDFIRSLQKEAGYRK